MKKAVRIDYSKFGPVVVCHLTAIMLKTQQREINDQAAACAAWLPAVFPLRPVRLGSLDAFVKSGVIR